MPPETGPRESSLTALRWSRLDPKNGRIGLAMEETNGEATIPITSTRRAAL